MGEKFDSFACPAPKRRDLFVSLSFRACLNFAFESTVSKFCSEQPVPHFSREGRRREHSQSYVTDAQRSAEQNLPLVGQSVKFKQALSLNQAHLNLMGMKWGLIGALQM